MHASCWRAAGTSPPRPRAFSRARAARCCPSRERGCSPHMRSPRRWRYEEGRLVSWPLAAFTLVAAVLALGWLAYERARPSARMVAVVATLAALTALGRDAFVALPDVKPITAMTLVVGYSLGALPGFTVGALGMLVSNVLLGQGPYTPWQMAAWGLVGLAGAVLARLSRRSLSRLALACACALCALAAKEVMNVYTWSIGASHTGAAFLAVAGTALPFDVTDAVASLLFGLAFAPELARLLERVRASGGEQARPRDLLPGTRAERRRGLRCRARTSEQRAVYGLGRDGPGGGLPQPAQRASRRALSARLAARAGAKRERRGR